MIELTKSEVNIISAGVYYLPLGMVLGGVFSAGWVASVLGPEGFAKNNQGIVWRSMMFMGSIGAVLGSVVGGITDLVDGT